MSNAIYETTTVNIAAGEYRFTVATSRVVFEGFRLAYIEADEEKAGKPDQVRYRDGRRSQKNL